jgi:putative transposase
VIRALITEAQAAGATRKQAGSAIGIDSRTVQRWRKKETDRRAGPKTPPKNKLTPEEEQQVLHTLNLPRFRDLAPNVVVTMLADEGTYLASQATMYRLLRAAGQLAHRTGTKPPVKRRRPSEQKTTAPNEVWCWDITYLVTPVRGRFHRLYLIMDVFSRKIVGWAVHQNETGEHAKRLMHAACAAEGAEPRVLHADNGVPMKSATMLATLQHLGVAASFSRPRVSNDNAYVESLFRTMKYCTAYPENGIFPTLHAAEEWSVRFVRWYNEEHRHRGIKYVTPAERHSGRDVAILKQRADVYVTAKRAHPARWSGEVRDWSRIDAVSLNPDVVRSDSAA